MRQHGKIDTTQPDIVRTLRHLGASVQSLASVGGGVPDILVGWHGMNILMEVKTGNGKLTTEQVIWHNEWTGRVAVVRSVEEAVAELNRAVKKGRTP